MRKYAPADAATAYLGTLSRIELIIPDRLKAPQLPGASTSVARTFGHLGDSSRKPKKHTDERTTR